METGQPQLGQTDALSDISFPHSIHLVSAILVTSFLGMMAVSTMGMSIAAEKALGLGKTKVGNKNCYSFDDLSRCM